MTELQRKLSIKKYLLAFFLTLLVFSGGIIIGMVIDKARLSQTNQVNLDEKANLRSLQLQQNYIESGIAKCDALNKILETNTNELAQKMAVLVDYEKKTIFNEAEFNSQLRDYFLTEIQFYFLNQLNN